MPISPAQATRNKDDSSDDDFYEPDEEELEEERQDAAVRLIQGLFRAKRARYIIRELVKANYVKEIDSLTGEPIYRNRRTGHISRRKPIFLGTDDLETPRYFATSDDYNPGKSAIPQFAVIITNQVFESPKIPNIPDQVLADHDALRETLEHPYFSKFQSENCFFVKNATSEVLVASLASVQAQVSTTMARLKKEAERRAKALRKERAAQAVERKKSRRTKKEGGGDAPSAGPCSDTSRRAGGGGRQEDDGGQEDADTEARREDEEEDREEDGEDEEDEEAEFDPQEGLLFVYVCTHAAVVSKGKGVAGTYLVTTDTSWKSKEQLAKTTVLLETFAAAIAGIQLRHKVVFLDVVHAEREHGGFKTRHLYPPRDLYDTAAALCGAVVVGSCRIGRTSEINLEKLRREATDFWDATERRRNGGGGAKGKRRLIDSDADSATGSGRSSGGHGGSGNESSSGGSGSSSSDSEGSTSSGDGDDDNLTDEESNSDAGSSSGSSSSNSSGSKSSRSRGGESAESSRSSGKEGSSQRKLVGEDCRSDGGARRSRVRRGTKRGKSRQVPQSPGNEARNSGGGNSIPATSWKSALAPGSSSSVVNGQRSEKGDTKACTAVYDRANYEETMSVFGRAVRDALKGQCIENIRLSRVLAVHLYNFIRRECAPFEHPRMSVVEEEAEAEGRAAGIGGKQEAAARRRKEAAERKAKKEAEKAEAKRRAKLGAKAAAEEIRKAKEAAILREIEEERRRRTQLPVISGLSISAIAQATVCASPSPPPRPLTPFPVEVTRKSVRLGWQDPPFPGEPPGSYELEARGDLRGNSSWVPVFPPWYPTILSQPVNIPHRVPGLGLRYRVRACNHGGWGAASDPSELVTTKAWLEDVRDNAAAHAMEALARNGGARLVLARMRRYSASLLVQESGFHQLVAEFNRGRGIARASLAQEVAIAVADAMKSFSQVRGIQASGLLLLGWAARGKGESEGAPGWDSLPGDLVQRCLEVVATAEKLHSMDVAIKSHAGWAKFYLQREEGRENGAGAIVKHRAPSSEEDAWAGTSSLADEEWG